MESNINSNTDNSNHNNNNNSIFHKNKIIKPTNNKFIVKNTRIDFIKKQIKNQPSALEINEDISIQKPFNSASPNPKQIFSTTNKNHNKENNNITSTKTQPNNIVKIKYIIINNILIHR